MNLNIYHKHPFWFQVDHMKFFSKAKQKKPIEEIGKPPVASEEEAFFREVDIEFLIHEMKDPVAVIETGMRSLLERPDRFGPLTDRQEKTIKRNLRSCRKARDMLNHLLEIGRSQAGCYSLSVFKPSVALFEALVDALETMAADIYEEMSARNGNEEKIRCLANRNILFEINPGIQDIEIRQDEVKFRQIAGNLIKNGLHHRREKLIVRLRPAEGQYLILDVCDDGPGVGAEYHQTIFERYTRLNECALPPRSGHGLGLAGARIVARRLGGDIRVQSEAGRGATFEFLLPLSFQEPLG